MTNPDPILVTGGAGYIGSHVVLRLLAQARVWVVDNFSRGHAELLPNGVICHRIDLRDRAGLLQLFRAQHFRAVVHMAAFAYVGESMSDPGLYFANNIGGTQNLLDAMIATQVNTLVFSSTCAVYGLPQAPLTEAHPLAPVNPYGESKLTVERMLRWYREIHGLRYLALRYFNAAGADAAGRAGEWHEPEPHLIPRLLQCAATGAPFPVYGTNYSTRDGSCIRDYIHVTDLADAHAAALRFLEEQGASGALNLGTGAGVSVLEAVHFAQQLLQRRIALSPQPRRLGDPAALVAESRRAQQLLGWSPRHSHFDEILRTAWSWHQRPASPSRVDAAHA